jgi:hypothetical protein
MIATGQSRSLTRAFFDEMIAPWTKYATIGKFDQVRQIAADDRQFPGGPFYAGRVAFQQFLRIWMQGIEKHIAHWPAFHDLAGVHDDDLVT